MFNIIVKNYEHYNRAMGKHISSKAHYEKEMAKGGYIPFEEGCSVAEKKQQELHKPYDKLSDKAMEVVRSVSHRKGNIKLSENPKLVEAMEEVGVSFDMQHCPKHYQEGGFGGEENSN